MVNEQEKHNPKEDCIEKLPSAPEGNRRSNKQFIPNEIDLENIPYEPLPPSPHVWEVKSNYFKELHSDTDLFLVLQDSNWEITKNTKMVEEEEKPDTFYKEVRFSLGGTLFIDKNGNNNRFAGCKSSLLKRGGITISVTFQTGNPKDWIYASGYSVDQKHVYLGSYAGKIVKINQSGMPIKVYDISNTPRWVIDTGDCLYIQADTRLYILANGEALIDLVDIWDKEKLIVGDNSFGFLGYKHLR